MNRILHGRSNTSRALAAPPVANSCFSLRAAAWLIMLLAVAPCARAQPAPAVDWAAAHDPATARIALTREQMAQARLNVPAGTRAYAIGGAQATRQLLAWYRASDGKLLAALEVVAVERPVAHDGVRVHAGAGTQGRATALLEVGTPRDNAALLAAHDLTLRSADAGAATAVPLLTYRGSAHIVALAPSAEQKLLRAPKFDVQARNAAGLVQTELLGLSLTGGAVPIAVTGGTTKPRVPVDVFVMNPGSEPRYVQAELKPPLQWQQRAGESPPANPQAVNVVAAPQTRTPLGSVLSDTPGAFNLSYRDVPVNTVESGNLSSGPLVGDPNGNTGLVLRSQDPLSEARINYDAPSNLVRTQPRPPAPAATLTEPSGRSGNHLQRVVLIGALAGTATLALRDRAGRDHQGEVTIVPNEERDLQRQEQWVTIAAVETGAPVWIATAAQDPPCKCEKVVFSIPDGKTTPEITLTKNDDGSQKLIVKQQFQATVTCQTLTGERIKSQCSAELSVDEKLSDFLNLKDSKGKQLDVAGVKVRIEDIKDNTCFEKCDGSKPVPVIGTLVFEATIPKGTVSVNGRILFWLTAKCEGKKFFGTIRTDISFDLTGPGGRPGRPPRGGSKLICNCDRIEFEPNVLQPKAEDIKNLARIIQSWRDTYLVVIEIPYKAWLTCTRPDEKANLCSGRVDIAIGSSQWSNEIVNIGGQLVGGDNANVTDEILTGDFTDPFCDVEGCDGRKRAASKSLIYKALVKKTATLKGELQFDVQGVGCAKNGSLKVKVEVEFAAAGKSAPASKLKVTGTPGPAK